MPTAVMYEVFKLSNIAEITALIHSFVCAGMLLFVVLYSANRNQPSNGIF